MPIAIVAALLTSIKSAGQTVDRTSSSCQSSTVDENYPPEFAAQAKKFLGRQAAVSRNDRATVAALTSYPAHVYQDGKVRKVRDRAEFLRNYSLVLRPEIKRAILNQSVECLFANGQGVMIGDGQVWFAQVGNGAMKITTFNLIAAKRAN